MFSRGFVIAVGTLALAAIAGVYLMPISFAKYVPVLTLVGGMLAGFWFGGRD